MQVEVWHHYLGESLFWRSKEFVSTSFHSKCLSGPDWIAFTQWELVPFPLRSQIPPLFIIWHYKDGRSLTMEMIFSFTMAPRPSFGQHFSRCKYSGFSHPCQPVGPAQWRNESPRCLKAQPVSSPKGLAIHSLHIVLQATMVAWSPALCHRLCCELLLG